MVFQEKESWLGSKPFIISGPCSAESYEQLMVTAKQLAVTGQVDVFRAGIWKPRTRPNGFCGVGKEGLEWMVDVKKETGFKTAIEVMEPSHVELALKYNIDYLWIGARTVVNPFSMDDLAAALEGVDNPILVKNPVVPDLSLWIGALERLHGVGVRKLAVIHRGFYPYNYTHYRNAPLWEIPIELKRLYPSIPIICDPSHIGGARRYIKEISQKSIDLAMDGLMIESHCSPDKAWTDSRQQITPKEVAEMLSSLIYRNSCVFDSVDEQLRSLRFEIDRLDEEILQVLSNRMKIVDKIAACKSDHKMTIFQLNRWAEMIPKRMKQGITVGLDEGFVNQFFKLIHKYSIERQMELYKDQQENDKEISDATE